MDWGYRGNSSKTIAKKGGVQVNGLKAQKLITGSKGGGGVAGERVKSSETHNQMEGGASWLLWEVEG